MKKKLKILFIFIFLLICTGCDEITFNKDIMDDIDVYTSIYPIEYVTSKIYKDNANINSMYPAGTNPYKYNFTKKQVEDFGKSDLIIYNGLTKERNNVVNMLNKNKNLKIIDATARIEYTYDIDEIWMNPSNLLTIAQNIKSGLNEYVSGTYLKNEIESNYEDLKLELSRLDADIKDDINNANYKTIVSTTDSIKIFEKYGLTVYSLDKDSINDKTYSEITKLIDNGDIKFIYTSSIASSNDYIKEIKEKYPSVEFVELNTLNNITDSEKKNKKDYITIMNENRDKLKKELYK